MLPSFGIACGICRGVPIHFVHMLCGGLLATIAVLMVGFLHLKKKNAAQAFDNAVGTVPAEEEKVLLEKIEAGLEKQEFKMYLQFVVDNTTKQIMSAEALARWEDATGGIIPPGEFIPIMEKFGLIARLDYHMFELTCKKLESWRNTKFSDFAISCNFTRITISEADFVTRLKEIADRYTFDHSKLLIEITEDAVERNRDVAMRNIMTAKALGFLIALDDIGTGYTSLTNLCEYPLDVVKIDRDVLLKTEHEKGKRLFFGIISLAHYLDLKVVCEGVETEAHNSLVSESDCDYIQGWYYSKALPERHAEVFAKEYMQVF